jgi:hypothetical protein
MLNGQREWSSLHYNVLFSLSIINYLSAWIKINTEIQFSDRKGRGIWHC